MNQITSCLKEYYPQAVGLFSRLDAKITIAFLRKFPNPKTLSVCKRSRFVSFLKKQHYTWYYKVEELWEKVSAPAPMADRVVEKASTLRLKTLLDQLEPLKEHQASYEREIQTILDKLADFNNIPTLPGVDKRLAPELAAVLGPKDDHNSKRFESAADIYNLAGCAPITRSSGKWHHVSIRRACVKPLRRTFWDWAFASLSTSTWARAYYDYEKARGSHHSTILRNLGRKWAKILFAIWSTGKSYDEALHIKHLKKRNVPWAIAL
jgi:transposase